MRLNVTPVKMDNDSQLEGELSEQDVVEKQVFVLRRRRKYQTTRRRISDIDKHRITCGNLDTFKLPEDGRDSPASGRLMEYFRELAKSHVEESNSNNGNGNVDEYENVDLERVEQLLHEGADINATDESGQTILHEVARRWHTDVARFMIEQGANVDQCDGQGRTPLHVAAAANYVEMIKLLLEKGADISATCKYNSDAMAFAAANDACDVIKVLLQYKPDTDINRTGRLGRTPLMVAALGDRSEVCKLLLSLGAKANVIDDNREPCIVTMLANMPSVATIALDQFHVINGAKREQYYHLNHIEPRKPLKEGDEMMKSRMPIEIIVRDRQHENIKHPVFQQLLDVKWKHFGKWAARISFMLDLVYILLWTLLAVIRPDARACYYFPGDVGRILLWIAAISYTFFLIFQELREFYTSRKDFGEWKEWKLKIIEDDIDHCHPQWPQEKEWLNREKGELEKKMAKYFHDYWNLFDWFVYILLTICLILHLVDIGVVSDELCWPDSVSNSTVGGASFMMNYGIGVLAESDELESAASKTHIRLFAITIIFLWVRILKPARAFVLMGPFIVMCYNILADVGRFCFLYLIVYIPYVCAFWMLFGGEVERYETFQETLFTLFRMTLVDEYNYDGLKAENPIMCDILVGTYLAISAIVFLNLFVAMLSETFVRIHDNASSNALMERAKIILSLEDGLSDEKKQSYLQFIDRDCSPSMTYYDDDMEHGGDNVEEEKVTVQIKEQVASLTKIVKGASNIKDKSIMDTIDSIHTDMQDMMKLVKDIRRDRPRIERPLTTLGLPTLTDHDVDGDGYQEIFRHRAISNGNHDENQGGDC